MVRLVLFDIDGTLIRTHGAGVKAFERTFAAEFGIPDATRHMRFAGRTDPSIAREIFCRHGLPASPDNMRRFFDVYPFWLDHVLAHSRSELCVGVWNFLQRLNRLTPAPRLGLLTGNIRLGAEIKLRHFQLWDMFELGAFGDDHEDRDELARVAQLRGAALRGEPLLGEEIVVVGDTDLDVRCSRAIEARMLAVATGGNTLEELLQQAPTWAVADLSQISAEEICGLTHPHEPTPRIPVA